MYRGKSIAVVVPAMNVEHLLPRVIDTMPAFVDWIVVVEDCGKDRTAAIAQERIDKGDRRIVLQGEAIQHHTSGAGSDRNRWGGYLDLAYRPNRYCEGGIRGDSTRLPFPQDGQESAISAYVTRFLTEQTSMRLQVRHGSRPDKSGFTEVYLQFLFGFGPHLHLLQ